MNTNAKKLIFAVIIFLLAVAAWQSILGDGMHINIDGDEVGGPLGAVLGVVFGGAGMVLAGLVMASVAVFLCLLFASLGVVAVAAVALLAVVLVAAVSPLLLPLVFLFGIYWLLVGRPRKQRRQATLEQPV